MDKKCILCHGKMLKVISDNVISYEIEIKDKYACLCTDKYVCSKCGLIQEYARIPEKTDDEDGYDEDEQLVFY